MSDNGGTAVEDVEAARVLTWAVVNGMQEPSSLEEAVYQAGAAFSACWDDLDRAGVFLDERAVEVGRALIEWIEARYEPKSPAVRPEAKYVPGQSTFGSVTDCPDCGRKGKYDGRVLIGGRGVYTCPELHRWQNMDETPNAKGYIEVGDFGGESDH